MARFGVKEVADITFYDIVTNEPVLFLDTLKMSNLENDAETSYATGGKGAPRLVGWDFNRTSTFTVQDALINPKALAMQNGTELEKKVESVHKRELTVAEEDTNGDIIIKLEKEPEGKVLVYKTTDGYDQEDKVDTGDLIVSGDEVQVVTGLSDKDRVLVYYTYKTEAEAEVMTIESDKFGGYYKVVGDTFWRNEATGQDEMVQIVIPRAKISSQFTLTMQPDGEPSVFDFNLDVFKDSNSSDMVRIVKY